jgi:hypothetical protein
MVNILKQEVNWKTTAYDGELLNKINKILTINLKIICQNIIKTFPKVTSIYLTLSFSRGEGSVLVENGKIKFLSDHDILVISDAPSYLLQLRKKQFIKNFSPYELCNIEVMRGHPIVELTVMNAQQIRKLPPSLFKHELKTAVCIYGHELLNPPPKIDLQKIPPTEGLSLLFNRMLGALIPFSTNFLKSNSKLGEEQRRHLTFESVKLISGCRDALLILDKFFGLTEKEKQEYFKRNWHTKYRWLNRKFPEFLDLSEKAHLYRIKPNRELEKESLALWFKSRQITSEVLRLYLNKLYKIEGDNWSHIIDKFMIKTFYKRSYRLYAPFSSFLSKAKTKKVEISLRRLNRILAVLILLLFSVGEDSIDELMLEKAKRIVGLNTCYMQRRDNVKEIWTVLKEIVCAEYIPPLTPPSSFSSKFQTLIAEVSSLR